MTREEIEIEAKKLLEQLKELESQVNENISLEEFEQIDLKINSIFEQIPLLIEEIKNL